jgi:signal peptidase I
MESTTILLILMWLGIRVGLGLFFKKAHHAFWKAFIPVYSTLIWLDLIKRPKWWLVLTFIPVINLVLGIGMIVELLNVFGKRTLGQHVMAALFGYLFLPYYGSQTDLKYVGIVDYKKTGKSKTREWGEAIFFAVIAATIIRTFTIEAFQIPSSSMEKTLLTGDFLFVSKLHYGAKSPQTPLALPFMHHSMPFGGLPAYLDWIELPYFRLPAFQDIKRKDIVVFNYPREDYRPSDKREHYIKRCVAIAGDTLQVTDGVVKINNDIQELPETAQHSRLLITNNYDRAVNWGFENDLNMSDFQIDSIGYRQWRIICHISEKDYSKLTKKSWISIPTDYKGALNEKMGMPGGGYPFKYGLNQINNYRKRNKIDSSLLVWNKDFYGPIYIPKKGRTIKLNTKNIILYERVINAYEKKQIVGLETLIENYNFIKEIQSKEFKFGKRSSSAITYDLNNTHSTQKFMEAVKRNFHHQELTLYLEYWADQFYMRTYFSEHRNYERDVFKELDSKLTAFIEENGQKEIDWILNQFKIFNKDWSSKESIPAISNYIQKNSSLYMVDDVITNEYTFEQDYFFMMGDNRHASADSRAWGFVPQDHIVGKAVFVWLSMDPDFPSWGDIGKKVRWNRLCSFVSRDGMSRSYLWEFLIGGIILWGANKWWKHRTLKKKSE